MNPRLRLMLIPLLAIVVAVVLLGALVRFLEPQLAFFPIAGERETPREFGVAYQPLTIETSDGERLRAWSIVDGNVRARILYFHGNGANLSVWAPIVASIAKHEYAVLAFDYRGYGLSTGRPTERGLYRDVEAAIERFWQDTPAGVPAVYWGRSLGVVMAAYASSIRLPDGLILEAGFPDARSLIRASPLLALLAPFSTYRFPAGEFLERRDKPCPVLVLHGDDDRVVPIAHGRALFERISGPKRFVVIRGGDHNDASPSDPQTYWEAVGQFIESLNH